MSKKNYFMIHSAVTIMPKAYIIGMNPHTGQPIEHKEGKEEEICQFACEFHHFPMPEHHFEKAFDEMKARCLAKARSAGLVKA